MSFDPFVVLPDITFSLPFTPPYVVFCLHIAASVGVSCVPNMILMCTDNFGLLPCITLSSFITPPYAVFRLHIVLLGVVHCVQNMIADVY